MATRPSLLITGLSGFLGWNLAQEARDTWTVAGTYYRTPRRVVQAHFGAFATGRIDLAQLQEVREMLAATRPDVVIHTAALANPILCERYPDDSFRSNVAATSVLANLCADRGIPLVFVSTDLVFDGTQAPYREEDPVSPVNVYGEHKALAEEVVLDSQERVVVCRMPLMFGRPSPTHGSFLQWMLPKMEQGAVLHLFHDEYRTPVSAGVAARGLLQVAERLLPDPEEPPITGRLHLGGRERISRYDFGRLVQELGGYDRVRLEPVSVHQFKGPAARPPDVSLDSGRAYAAGYDPPPLRDQVRTVLGMAQEA